MVGRNSSRAFAPTLAETWLGAVAAKFEGKGWATRAGFAYACGGQPGQPEHDTRFVDEVAVPLTGDRGSPVRPQLRRLLHESWAYQLAELRRAPVARVRVGRPRR